MKLLVVTTMKCRITNSTILAEQLDIANNNKKFIIENKVQRSFLPEDVLCIIFQKRFWLISSSNIVTNLTGINALSQNHAFGTALKSLIWIKLDEI